MRKNWLNKRWSSYALEIEGIHIWISNCPDIDEESALQRPCEMLSNNSSAAVTAKL